MNYTKMTKSLIVALSLGCSFSAFSQADLGQQLSLAQDSISHIISDMSSRQASSSLNLRDYHSWERNFKSDMEESFTSYEKELKIKVFGPLQEVVGRYNKIQADNKLPVEQKKNILNSIIGQIESMVPALEIDYKNLLVKLYHSNNVFPDGLTMNETVKHYDRRGREVSAPVRRGETKNVRTFKLNYANPSSSDTELLTQIQNYYFLYGDKFDNDAVYFDLTSSKTTEWKLRHLEKLKNCDDRFYTYYGCEEYLQIAHFTAGTYVVSTLDYKTVFKRIVEGCESRACVMIKSSDISYSFESIRSMLDKNIVISLDYLAGKKTITIKSPSVNIRQYTDVLKRTDYSNEVAAMPFDI